MFMNLSSVYNNNNNSDENSVYFKIRNFRDNIISIIPVMK